MLEGISAKISSVMVSVNFSKYWEISIFLLHAAALSSWLFLHINPGGTPILKLYGDVPPFRVWFFDCPLINRVLK